MSIHVALNHVTHYRYDRPVQLGPQVVRLRPAPHGRTRILSYSLTITPAQHFVNWQQDANSNYLARLTFPERVEEFRIEVDLIAEIAVQNPFDFFLEPYARAFPFDYAAEDCKALEPYRELGPLTPRLAERLAELPARHESVVDFLVALNLSLSRDIRYVIRMEPGVQAPEDTLSLGSGSCRDSAWLLVQLLRRLGFAARFASGYLIQLVPDVVPLDGPAGPSADFTDLHAWCEVYLPGAGWIGLDPTSGLLAGEGHVPLACTADPASAAPVTGLVEESDCTFSHEMQVRRIAETPRVTKPYAEAEWLRIEQAGHLVDARLARGDVRLTMGGEPTFVSIDDPDGAEWNTAALGPTKRLRAADLFHRLRAHYAPEGLTHFGQGKWYPGEPLPRWSLNCFWRRDGQPLWHDAALVADEARPAGSTPETGAALLALVAGRLGVDAAHAFAAYEDAFYYLWRERRLPANVDPFDSRLEDAVERGRLARIFDEGLAAAVGHVLPLARDAAGRNWASGPWFLRSERCYLLPGDSPLGYRLPLDSQPWVRAAAYPYVHGDDPSVPKAPLAAPATIRVQPDPARRSDGPPAAVTAPGVSADGVVRTALCTQSRGGVLYVFMPPLASADDYVELVGAIEWAAGRLGAPVLLEGYEPPRDPRLESFRVTPDPGVIEVNVHPAAGWTDLVERTTHLYDTAREARLGAEKFMLDGRHTGTGGGNHFVLGGATPADSPFLRRPDLLGSLVAYWHNHPALSYLFSGLFVGPTSQAPRVDEARNDALYELEIALQQVPDPGTPVPPWLVDRLFRNLLVDVTGNTHRAEFCVDKLYAPEGAAGRLGLVELRAFEMPPHARMSLAQQLLLRSLVARFWEQPYRPARLARWGTELHDRFMLPYFIERDLDDVVAELRAQGLPIEASWFAPHLEFRCPRIGDVAVSGIELELRQALEPWHVMGEEGGGGGTVRYVDSSVERIEARVTGLAPDRYVLACNGRRVPLRPTGRAGEYVGGIRYRAWQPASALHPRLEVDAPLRFDLVDGWMERSIGGCQYHVMHPGGRHYDTFPVNAFESESRRRARFFRMGHTPGHLAPPEERPSAEYPFTLDLRRR